MSTILNSYYSKSKIVGTEMTLIPVDGSGDRKRNTILEVHNFEMSASRMTSEVLSDWFARVDVYIKSGNNIYYIFNNIVMKDGGRYYNEKTFNLLPNQSLCYKIKELSSISTEPDIYHVKVSASTIEMKDDDITGFKVIVNPTPSNADVLLTYTEEGISTSYGYIVVPENSTVAYKVSASHYRDETGNITASASGTEKTKTVNVELTKLKKITITSSTPDAYVDTLTSSNTNHIREGNSIWVDNGETVTYQVKAPHYRDSAVKTFSVTSSTPETKVLNVNLEVLMVNFEITQVDPSDAIVTINGVQKTSAPYRVNVQHGSTIEYSVEKEPFVTKIGKINSLESDVTIPLVELNYPTNYLIYEKNENTTETIDIRNGVYEIIAVGAGGGGIRECISEGWYGPGGGSGSYLISHKSLTSGSYEVKVGKGGLYLNAITNTPYNKASDGGDTSFAGQIAGGGKGAYINSFRDFDAGEGGEPSGDSIVESSYGEKGTKIGGQGYTLTYVRNNSFGGTPVYEDKGAGGKTEQSGSDGYIKITYLRPLA